MDLEDQVDNSMVDHSKDFNRSNLETIDLWNCIFKIIILYFSI